MFCFFPGNVKNCTGDFVLWYSSTVKNKVSLNLFRSLPFWNWPTWNPALSQWMIQREHEVFCEKPLTFSSSLLTMFYILEFSPLTVLGNPQMFWHIFSSGFVIGSVGGIKSLFGLRWGPFVSFIVWNQSGGKSLLTFTFLLQCIVQRFSPSLEISDLPWLLKNTVSWSLISMESKSADLL